MKIIGFVGFAGSGKGTAGDILESKFGFKKESFAKPLKDAVAAIFGWDRNLLEGDTKESREFRESQDEFWNSRIGPMTPRKALQLMGTEAGRDIFHPNVWLYSLEKRLDENYNYVITDVRFPNEIAFLKNLDALIIRVKSGIEPLWYEDAFELNTNILYNNQIHVMEKFPGIHYSEWAWIGNPQIDFEINNEGTLKDFETIITRVALAHTHIDFKEVI